MSYSVKAILKYPQKKEEQFIYIRLIISRKKKIYKTDYKVTKDFWNPRKGEVSSKHGNSTFLNNQLKKKKDEVEKAFLKLDIQEKTTTIETVNQEYQQSKPITLTLDLFQYIKERNEAKEKLISSGTLKAYKQIIPKLESFLHIKYKRDTCDLHEINYDFIEAFEGYLSFDYVDEAGEPLEDTTVYGLMKRFRMYLNEAIKKQVLTYNPFSVYRLVDGESQRGPLFEEELKRLINTEMPTPGMEDCRLRFLFQCNTGLAYADLMKLEERDIRENAIDTSRIKTGTLLLIPLTDTAKAILKKLPKRIDGKIFDHISVQNYNKMLHKIEAYLDFKRPLTTHVARHTFATILFDLGEELIVVSALLGHRSLRTTQSYVKVQMRRRKAAINRLDDFNAQTEDERKAAAAKTKELKQKKRDQERLILQSA